MEPIMCDLAKYIDKLFLTFHSHHILVKISIEGEKELKSSFSELVFSRSDSELFGKILELVSERARILGNGVKLELENDLVYKDEEDFERKLLDTLLANEPSDDNLRLGFDRFPRWFTEWSLTLTRLVKTSYYNSFGIPLDICGVLVFCCGVDSVDLLKRLVRSESGSPRALVVIGDNLEVFMEGLGDLKSGLEIYLVRAKNFEHVRECLESDDFADFMASFVRACVDRLRRDPTTREKQKHLLLKLMENASKLQVFAEYTSLASDCFIEMSNELKTGNQGFIQSICRASSDNEIKGIAYAYSAIANVKCENNLTVLGEVVNVDHFGSEMPRKDRAIADLNKATNVFLKLGRKWDALLTLVYAVVIGGEAESRRLGLISAGMELKTKCDYSRAAISLESCTFFGSKIRKKLFSLVMAGHLFVQAGLQNIAKRCYLSALPHYEETGWKIACEHLYGTLSRYDSKYCINALNGFADSCEYDHCLLSMKAYNEFDILVGAINPRSSWHSTDREVSHLRRLMKLMSTSQSNLKFQPTAKKVACSYNCYKTLVFDDSETPLLDSDGNMPVLLRIPLVFLRSKEGVPGRNCNLTLFDNIQRDQYSIGSVEDFNSQEIRIYQTLKDRAKTSTLWKKCFEFANPINSLVKGDKLANFVSSFPSSSDLVLQLELINPLHIAIHCESFYLLLKFESKIWWEKLSVVVLEDIYESRLMDVDTRRFTDEDFVYLKESERRKINLKFRPSKIGSLNIMGIRWKLFGCVSCWMPLYLSGPRKTRGQPLEPGVSESLTEYLSKRHSNFGLWFSIVESQPQVSVSLHKCISLPTLNSIKIIGSRPRQLLESKFSEDTENTLDEKFDYLTMTECESGEYILTRLSIKNIGKCSIGSISLELKSVGSFIYYACPIAINSSDEVSVLWEDSGNCMKNQKSNKVTFQKTPKNDSPNILEPDATFSIYTFMIPLAKVPHNLCYILGRITISPHSGNTNIHIPFIRFFLLKNSLTAISQFDPTKPQTLSCNLFNNSDRTITNIHFYYYKPLEYSKSGENGEEYNEYGGKEERIMPIIKCPTYSTNSSFQFHSLQYFQDSINELNDSFQIDSTRLKGIFVRGQSRCSVMLPWNAEYVENRVMRIHWRVENTRGDIYSVVTPSYDAQLLVTVVSDVDRIQWKGKPCVVNLYFNFENVASQTFPSCDVEASGASGPRDGHKWFFVGITVGKIPQIEPGKSQSIMFSAMLPMPGAYVFTPSDISVKCPKIPLIAPNSQLIILVTNPF